MFPGHLPGQRKSRGREIFKIKPSNESYEQMIFLFLPKKKKENKSKTKQRKIKKTQSQTKKQSLSDVVLW